LNDQGTGITANRNDDGPAPTEDQRKFIDEYYQQSRLIDAIIKRGERDADREAALKRVTLELLDASKFALEDAADVPLGRSAIRGILANVIHEYGQNVRAAYLWDLAYWYFLAAVSISVIAILVYAVTHYFSLPQEVTIPGPQLILLVVALTALLAGAWLSAAARLEPDSAEVVASIFSSTLNAGYVLCTSLASVSSRYCCSPNKSSCSHSAQMAAAASLPQWFS
jgi:hypothetical protein